MSTTTFVVEAQVSTTMLSSSSQPLETKLDPFEKGDQIGRCALYLWIIVLPNGRHSE
jgi:hypothetical protein